jgi:hypothetical protein
MEAASSKTLLTFYQMTWHHIAENMNLHALMLLGLCSRDMRSERVGLVARRNLLAASLQCTFLPYNMDELPPAKEMRYVIEYCRGRRKELIIGYDTIESYILWVALGLIQDWRL